MQKRKKGSFLLLLLCTLFGLVGAHRFYRGMNITGTLMLLTFGGIGIWYLIDLARILMGKFPDKKKKVSKKKAYS